MEVLRMQLNITYNSVVTAMKYIDKNGVPVRRGSKGICVFSPNGSTEYPVKYVCEIAHNSIKSNATITPADFVSHDAARALKNLNFKVIGFGK